MADKPSFDGLIDPDAGWNDVPRLAKTCKALAGEGGPMNAQAWAIVARIKYLAQELSNFDPNSIGGLYRNLYINVSGTGYQGTITVDKIVVEGNDFFTKLLRSVSVSFNGATVGANGLDTGAIVAGSWYYLYIICNNAASTVASLISLSPTAPTLPDGYTQFALVGCARVQAATTAFVRSIQRNNEVSYRSGDAVNFIKVLDMGRSVTPALVSVSTAVPPIAKAFDMNCDSTGNGSILHDSSGAYSSGSVVSKAPATIRVSTIAGAGFYYKVKSGRLINHVIGYYL